MIVTTKKIVKGVTQIFTSCLDLSIFVIVTTVQFFPIKLHRLSFFLNYIFV